MKYNSHFVKFSFKVQIVSSFTIYLFSASYNKGFPGSSDAKVSACDAGDLGLIPGLGRSRGKGNGSPHQYSCLANSMDRGAW